MESSHVYRQSITSIAETINLYEIEPIGTRLFVKARHLLAPLKKISSYVPNTTGDMLDIGCGHGLFTAFIALSHKNRQIVAIDPDPKKIEVAQRIGKLLPNVKFELGSIEVIKDRTFSLITILDVLILLPYEEKLQMLRRCRQLIAKNGVLLLKTNDRHPAWKFAINRLQEWVMTKSRLTLCTNGLHLLSCKENEKLLQKAGFSTEIIHLSHWSPYPHTLFVARPV